LKTSGPVPQAVPAPPFSSRCIRLSDRDFPKRKFRETVLGPPLPSAEKAAEFDPSET
jgi:hypothetical protein